MAWEQIEATPAHKTYLLLSLFLIGYTLFATFIRNRLHLSEPPLALLAGIILGPRCLGWITPNFGILSPGQWDQELLTNKGWGWGDDVIQETARVIVGIQVFVVGVDLPKWYMSRHWKSVVMMLGPVMSFSWIICAVFVKVIFQVDWPSALVVGACLTPTDPVLAASILSNSQFSHRVPTRIKHLLSAESGCNDGISFPFLYVGLVALKHLDTKVALKEWVLLTLLWQCLFGTFIGLVIGTVFNRILRFSDSRGYVDRPGMVVFYLLLAIFSVGVGSTLGSDDFLVAFGAGYGFARDGWFSKRTEDARLSHIIDLLLNSAMFVYLGTIIPWHAFEPLPITPSITPGHLIGFLVLVLFFRRMPIVLVLYPWIPDIRTLREALFCGHFGPMGLGAIFLAIEARAVLENGTSLPDNKPPLYGRPYTDRERAVYLVWPLVCFIVLGSTMVHGLSVVVMSIFSHFQKPKHARAGILAAETEPLEGMVHEEGDGRSIDSQEEDNNDDEQ